jgi:hypothetical protein
MDRGHGQQQQLGDEFNDNNIAAQIGMIPMDTWLNADAEDQPSATLGQVGQGGFQSGNGNAIANSVSAANQKLSREKWMSWGSRREARAGGSKPGYEPSARRAPAGPTPFAH